MEEYMYLTSQFVTEVTEWYTKYIIYVIFLEQKLIPVKVQSNYIVFSL